jgi:CelD/BcsL family acetyltransferase involved in cellulose biosynthesis
MEKQITTIESSSGLQVRCIESLEDLHPIRSQIDDFSNNPFLKCSWMFPWIDTWCSDDAKLKFLVVERENQKVVGFAPLVLKNSLKRGRHIAFVGSGKACADYMTFPATKGCERDVVKAVSDWLACHVDQWDRIELDGVTESDKTTGWFCESMSALECGVYRFESLSSWRLDLPNTWDEFMTTLSKNSRKKYRRQAKALSGKSQLFKATDMATLREGLQVLEELHTKRWQSLGEPGCFGHPGFREFLTRVAEEKLQSDSLSLIWMTFEGQPLAADIGFHSKGGFFTYQGGISVDHLRLEPGRAILRAQIEYAMERGAGFIDFLRGDEPYKARYQTREIKNVRHEIVANNVKGRSTQTFLQLGRAIKSLMG